MNEEIILLNLFFDTKNRIAENFQQFYFYFLLKL